MSSELPLQPCPHCPSASLPSLRSSVTQATPLPQGPCLNSAVWMMCAVPASVTSVFLIPSNHHFFREIFPFFPCDRGTQELKILASVIVDRPKWLMHGESCYSRNWNEVNTTSTLVPQGVWRWYLSLCVSGRECLWCADKELLINRKRSTLKMDCGNSYPTPSLPFLLLIKRSVWDEVLQGFLRVHNLSLFRSPTSE